MFTWVDDIVLRIGLFSEYWQLKFIDVREKKRESERDRELEFNKKAVWLCIKKAIDLPNRTSNMIYLFLFLVFLRIELAINKIHFFLFLTKYVPRRALSINLQSNQAQSAGPVDMQIASMQ